MKIRVEAGAGDITDPVIHGWLVKLTADLAIIEWDARAWYTTGHIGLKFGPLRRVYSRAEYDHFLNSHGYDEIRISPPERKRATCSKCGHEL